MKVKAILVCVFTIVLVAAAYAGEQHRMHVEVVVDDDAEGMQVFSFDSADAGFDLQDMQIGESRTITGESGETALVVRTEDGFEFDVNGKKIQLDDMGDGVDYTMGYGEHHAEMLINADEDVHIARKVKVMKFDGTSTGDNVTIITNDSLDDATQQQIRDVLLSSGRTGEVTFIDTNNAHGDHAAMERVHVIRQEVDVTN